MSRSFDLILDDTILRDVCSQTIEFRTLRTMDVMWPPRSIAFSCDVDFPTLDNGFPDPGFTGEPMVYLGGVAVAVGPATADDLSVTFGDSRTTDASGNTVLQRMWIVTANCDGAEQRFIQTFYLPTDGMAYFECPISNHYCPIVDEDVMLWPMEPFTCQATVTLPEPVLNNVCDTTEWTFVTDVFAVRPNGDSVLIATLNEGDDRTLDDLTAGDYLIRYSGSHPSDTIDVRYCRIRVADLDSPTAVCKSNLSFSLNGAGGFLLPHQIVNQGSYDNCDIVNYDLRRQISFDTVAFGGWSPAITFDCEDVGTVQNIQLRVIDAAGNDNICATTVVIMDNTLPYCTGLDDLTVGCDELPSDFNAFDTTQLRLTFGMPVVVDNCSAEALELAPEVLGDNCSPDQIRRRFRALDQHGNFSAGLFFQTITIIPTPNYSIRFPADITTDCVTYGDSLEVVGGGCDSITYTFTDSFLAPTGTECRIVQRDYVVTNWCEWDGSSAAVTIGRMENCTGPDGAGNLWVVRNENGVFTDIDAAADNASPAAGTCGNNPAGYLREVAGATGRYAYRQFIRIEDNTGPDFTIDMEDVVCSDTVFCRTLVETAITVSDACQMDEGNVVINVDVDNDGTFEGNSNFIGNLTGDFPNYRYEFPLRVGTHRYQIVVTDDCGNRTTQERIFQVADCYVPALTCRQDRIYELEALLIATDVDGDGIVEEAVATVEAFDLGRCEFTDCSGELIYSVNRVGEPIDPTQTTLFLDCQDRYTVDLEVYVWDQAFNPLAEQPDGTLGGPNWRMCVVTVLLQDPTLACTDCQVDGEVTISGNVTTVSGEPIEMAIVSDSLTGQGANSDAFGSYRMQGDTGRTFMLTVDKDGDPRDGISTLDMVILRMHLLGTRVLTDPYELMAADVNQDGQISLLDVVQLQALVLARTDLYPGHNGWRFVPADWPGDGPQPRSVRVAHLTDCSEGHDWIGFRLGDLNGSYVDPAGIGETANTVRGRTVTERPVAVELPMTKLAAGEEITLPLQLEGEQFLGGQLGLYWNPEEVEVTAVHSTVFGNSGYRLQPGQLWMSWEQVGVVRELAQLSVRARRDVDLSEAIRQRKTDVLTDEAYGMNTCVHPLFLLWNSPETKENTDIVADPVNASDRIEILGAFPNPVRTTTRVGYVVTESSSAQVQIFDSEAKLIEQFSVNLVSGEQWIELNLRALASGTYSVVLETESGRSTTQVLRQ